MLSLIDGMTLELPAFDLDLRPLPDDKTFNETQRADYFVDGMTIYDDCPLRDLLYRQSPGPAKP